MKKIDPAKISEEEKQKQIEAMWAKHENNNDYEDDYLYILDEEDEFYD